MNSENGAKSLELDAGTLQVLTELARTWGVSEEEAVRRALKLADLMLNSQDNESRLDAFNELQRRLSLTPATAAEWQAAVRETRR